MAVGAKATSAHVATTTAMLRVKGGVDAGAITDDLSCRTFTHAPVALCCFRTDGTTRPTVVDSGLKIGAFGATGHLTLRALTDSIVALAPERTARTARSTMLAV